jgi:hypothetical protein
VNIGNFVQISKFGDFFSKTEWNRNKSVDNLDLPFEISINCRRGAWGRGRHGEADAEAVRVLAVLCLDHALKPWRQTVEPHRTASTWEHSSWWTAPVWGHLLSSRWAPHQQPALKPPTHIEAVEPHWAAGSSIPDPHWSHRAHLKPVETEWCLRKMTGFQENWTFFLFLHHFTLGWILYDSLFQKL